MKTATTLADAADLTKEDIFDLSHAYKRYVAGIERDSGRQGVYHPSAIGMCGRMNVYEFVCAPQVPTISPEMLEIFDMGHHIHDLVQGRLEGMPEYLAERGVHFEFQREVKRPDPDDLYDLFGIGGTCDGQMRLWVPAQPGSEVGWEQRSTLEIKSINNKDFNALTGPKRQHEWQAHLYAFRFDTPIIYYWYFNKNNSKRRVYARPFDHECFNEALEKYVAWNAHVEAGTLPEREESWLSCKDCAYRKECQPKILTSKARRAAKKLSANRKKGLRRLHGGRR